MSGWPDHAQFGETERRLGARHHASGQREVSVVGALGLAVDVAQNAAANPNNPSDKTAAGRE